MLFLSLLSLVFAWEYNEQINKCLSKLKDNVDSQYSIDISSVSVDGEDADLSVYSWDASTTWQRIFTEVLKENPTTYWCENSWMWYSKWQCKNTFSNVFFAKRNNIATVKVTPEKEWKWYWTMTEFVTWWGSTKFDFPLQKWDDPQFDDMSYYSEWDDYWTFRENLVYVQYQLDGTFSSCWYINLDSNNLDNINQNNYMWNAFEEWGFEKLDKWDLGWDKFFGMKVLVKWLNWDKNDLFDLKLIGIAYDNDSSYFNEYIAYPLQIKAMTDITNMASENHTMENVINKYIGDYLINNTCFEISHESTSDLPSFCWWDFGSESDLISYNSKKSLFVNILDNLFVDKVYALSMPDWAEEKAKEVMTSNSIATRNGIKISTWEKINNISNESLKSRLIYILSPSSNVFIDKKEERWEYVSYDERIYSKCPLTHDQVAENVEYIFDNYYSNWELDLSSPRYLNAAFGDCMIPYPDVRHKDMLIENSFIQNKITFIQNKFWEKKVQDYEKRISNITNTYEKEVSNLKKEYQEALFSENKEKADSIMNNIENKYDKMQKEIDLISSNDKELSEYIEVKNEAFKNVSSKDFNNSSNQKDNTYIIFILIWIIILVSWLFLVYKKNKND